MFCPRCGQEAAGGLRFCSRCGLRLEGVARLLDNDGMLPQVGVPPEEGGASAKRKRIRQGAKLMFLSLAITPIFFGFCIIDDTAAPLIVPFTIFIASLLWMLYFRLFGVESAEAREPGKMAEIKRPPFKAIEARPGEQVISPGARPVNTGEMANRPSVTEGTTELFDGQ